MDRLTQHEILTLLLAVGVLLTAARIFGELAKKIRQPSVLGEIIAGILLGPTVLGAIAPGFTQAVFPSGGHSAIALDGLTMLAIVLFLLVAGMEVDLSTIWRQGRSAVAVGAVGIVIPFALGFGFAYALPELMGRHAGIDALIFALFMATALSITALPVIAKTLMDVNLYRSDFGMLVIAAAILNDVAGWIIFAVILGMMSSAGAATPNIGGTIGLTLLFTAGVLTAGRWLIHRSLPWLQAHTSWPGGVLVFALALALFGAAFTEWIGIHAIFGSFLVGVALGDSSHLREQTRATIDRFVSFIFAPLFFASIGLRLNFAEHFDPVLTAVILAVAMVGKVGGCGLAARWSGMPVRDAWAVGFAMNARGSMEIILGLLALQYGVISERLFVSLVIMAIVTSMLSGPLIEFLLHRTRKRRFTDFLVKGGFLPRLAGSDRPAVIRELVEVMGPAARMPSDALAELVWEREQVLATGLGRNLAVPHARIPGLHAPLLAVGLSPGGVDFDAPDGEPARIIFLLLTPEQDTTIQLEILADLARSFSDDDLREKTMRVRNHTEFLALMRSERKD